MKYRALIFFKDGKDNNRPYRAGDEYPRPGLAVSRERLEELATANNRMGRAVIEAIQEPVEKPKAETAKKKPEAKKQEEPKPKKTTRKKKDAD